MEEVGNLEIPLSTPYVPRRCQLKNIIQCLAVEKTGMYKGGKGHQLIKQEINENAAMLCNYEVLAFLKNLQEEKKGVKNAKFQENLNTIVYETVKYLEDTPCAQQSPESVKDFLVAINQFKLTKAEKLQILNQRPTTLVELQLMIEENEERFTEEQMHDILAVVARTLPGKSEPEDDDVMSDIIVESDDENR